MCGIYGLWSYERAFAAEPIAQALAHRGPDDTGTWQDGPVHLGHRRLSIIDLSAQGHQPISTPNGRYTLTYNGEIYNYLEIRSELETQGVSFISETDTEVLLQAYAAWGEAMLDRLYGMFAFAIWDREEEELFLARDATGIKPLHYVQLTRGSPREPGEFAFASELKAFLHIEGFPFEINDEAVHEHLGAGYVWSGDHTSIRQVRKLPAGHFLTVRRGRASEPVRWWHPPAPVAVTCPVHEALDRRADALYDLLRDVTDQHLRADVPVGLLLSGGLDSSILASITARCLNAQSKKPPRTLTMGFEPYAKDEREHARAVAAHIGSDHHEIVVRPADAAQHLLNNAHHFDDLFGDSGTIPAFAAFRFCREQDLKVVLVGEGADEIFGGYPQFRTLGGASSDWMPSLLRQYRFFQTYTRQRYGPLCRAFMERIANLHQQAGGDWFHTVRLFETLVQLPVSLNMKVDRASMASSVEARVPYQDRRVVEFAFRTPRALLLQEGRGKLLLRHMARRHDLVPASILARKKMGTPVPWGWMQNHSDFAASLEQTLLAPGSWTRRLGFAGLVRTYLAGRTWKLPHRLLRPFDQYQNHGWLVMNLFVLDAWAQSEMFDAAAAPVPEAPTLSP